MAEENKNIHFDISAAVIRQLGEELISDEVTAIMEIIKNSYDADADWVKVDISTKELNSNPNIYYKNSSKGYISIEDNGFGMSETDIWEKWMKLSLSYKKRFKQEGLVTPKGRTPLGDKGVGRLSTQKLGKRLELFTGQINNNKKSHVAFDWDQFEDDISLTAVPVYINTFEKKAEEKGTTLIITNLQEPTKWEGLLKDRFKGQLSQLLFPYKEKRTFDVYLKINGQIIDLDELSKNVRQNSVSSYDFKVVDSKLTLEGKVKLQKLNGSNNRDDISFYEKKILPDMGKDFFQFLTDPVDNKKNFVSEVDYYSDQGFFLSFKREILITDLDQIPWILNLENKTKEFPNPGDFSGEIYDFYFKDSAALENVFDSLAEFKRIVQNQTGVRIFRDGFGIRPYGLDGNDWLKLSGGQTSGGSFYGLRPGNIVGFVSITAKENKNLKEKTDREGFMESQYSMCFFRIVDYIIKEINSVLEGTRRSYVDYKSKIGQESAGIKDIKDSFTKLKNTSSKAKSTSNKAQKVKTNLAQISTKVQQISKKRDDKTNTEGFSESDELLKQIVSLLEEARILFNEVEEILNEAKALDQHVEFLQPQMENLEHQLSDFSELAGLGLTSEALSHELSNIVDKIIDETERINKNIKGKNTSEFQPFNIYVEYIRSASRSFKKQLSHLAPSLRYVRENVDTISISKFLAEIEDFYNDKFKGTIILDIKNKAASFNLSMNKGKLTQIIDNIILNSEYWLKEKQKSNIGFKPKIIVEVKEPFIRIYDNGNGIDPNVQDRIFQPFITTKPPRVGRGLGLFIVQQLLETNGCEIMLLSEKNEYNRRYIFQINLSSVIK